MNTETLIDQIKPFLCPPGDGVYTVTTGKDEKDRLQQHLYGCTGAAVEASWTKQLNALDNSRPIIFGVCADAGGGIVRGANWGPLFMRERLYAEKKWQAAVFDLGDVRVIPHLLLDKYLNEDTIAHCRQSLYGRTDVSWPVSPLSIAYEVANALYTWQPDVRLFTMGGDHSVSYPMVKAYLQAKRQQGKRVALIHFDAHTDLMKERLGIDICFGSWTYHVLPFLPDPSHLIQIGIRASGMERSYWESDLGIKQIWQKEIEQRGAQKVAEEIKRYLDAKQVDECYVTFDIDGMDAKYAQATGTPERDGLSLDQVDILINQLGKVCPIGGADLMEVAPFIRARYDYGMNIGMLDFKHFLKRLIAAMLNLNVQKIRKCYLKH